MSEEPAGIRQPFVLEPIDDVYERLLTFRKQGEAAASAGKVIVDHLRRLGAVEALREDEYVDRDYSSAFENFCGRFFRPPRKVTVRYHFFTRGFESIQQLPEAEEYLGFVVLWPTDPPVIGRTALRPPPGWHVLQHNVVSHVGRKAYAIPSIPYATKDFGVSACATIATWLATEVAGSMVGIPLTTSYDITRLAGADRDGLGLLPQRFGLNPEQIALALARLGFHPFIYDLEHFPWKALGTIFGALISDLPVILMVEFLPGDGGERSDIDGATDRDRHAVLAIGYVHDAERAEAGNGWVAGVTELLLHDDRYGPYLRAVPERDVQGVMTLDVDYDSGVRRVLVKQLIIPLPPKTYTISTDAHIAGKNLLDRWLANERVMYRTFLRPSRQLKDDSGTWADQAVAWSLATTQLPNRVWVTEASTRPLGAGSEVIGRAIMDASVLRDSSVSRYLWAHVRAEAKDVNVWDAMEPAELADEYRKVREATKDGNLPPAE